jgi:hypothetical protein
MGMAPAAAQQQAPAWLRLAYVKVKPSMTNEYLATQKQVSDAFKKAGQHRDLWTTAGFGEVGAYVGVTPLNKLADLDSPGPVQKAMGEAGYERYLAQVRNCLESVSYKAVLMRPELSLVRENAPPAKMAVVVNVQVAPGRTTDFEALIKSDYLPAWKKGGADEVWVNQSVFGVTGPEYIIVVTIPNFAELDKGNAMTRALGPEGAAKLSQKSAGIITGSTVVVSRRLEEYSSR